MVSFYKATGESAVKKPRAKKVKDGAQGKKPANPARRKLLKKGWSLAVAALVLPLSGKLSGCMDAEWDYSDWVNDSPGWENWENYSDSGWGNGYSDYGDASWGNYSDSSWDDYSDSSGWSNYSDWDNWSDHSDWDDYYGDFGDWGDSYGDWDDSYGDDDD